MSGSTQRPPQRPTIALVHGGFLGAWIWRDVAAVLEGAGHPVLSLDLPSVQSVEGAEVGNLDDDVRAVRDLLGRAPTPVVLCGHSAGGVVISQAAAGRHPAVDRLVYLTAVVPDAGESMSTVPTTDPADEAAGGGAGATEPVIFRDDGLLELDPDHATAALFNDCSAARAAEAIDQLRPMNPAVGSQPVTGVAWRERPSTLVLGSRDRLPQAITPAFRAHEPEVIDLPTGHCPNWSRPELVAEVLASVASRVEG